jgi:hypothetical protein
MLNIPSNSFESLERDHRNRFHEDVYRYLAKEIPEAVEPRPKADVMAAIAAAHRRANERQIEEADNVVRFSALWLVSGPDFDRIPAVDDYLKSPDGTTTRKLDLLLREVSAGLDKSGG